MPDDDFRASVLRAHGAGAAETDELLAYTASRFTPPEEWPALPLVDEPCVAAWDGYAAEAGARGAWAVLRERLPQLRFPVREGMSADEAYRAATRRGEASWPAEGEGLALSEPGALRIFVHPTPAGRLPVLVAGHRDDFTALVCALARHNEPSPIPASMGALAVGGFANWDRVAALKRAWGAENPGADGEAWRAELRALAPRKELYQDRFVILSEGPYSGVPAGHVGMDEEAWARASLAIRLEHECAHYFSRRLLGAMSNTAHDELAADYAGITAAAGRYRAGWALRFLGLEAFPAFREEGRLANYRGDPPLSEAAFAVLRSVAHAAVQALARFDAERREVERTHAARGALLAALFGTALEEMAAEDGAERLRGAWMRARGADCVLA
jgi:hypothetical protein